jgi:hypothetical protein
VVAPVDASFPHVADLSELRSWWWVAWGWCESDGDGSSGCSDRSIDPLLSSSRTELSVKRGVPFMLHSTSARGSGGDGKQSEAVRRCAC